MLFMFQGWPNAWDTRSSLCMTKKCSRLLIHVGRHNQSCYRSITNENLHQCLKCFQAALAPQSGGRCIPVSLHSQKLGCAAPASHFSCQSALDIAAHRKAGPTVLEAMRPSADSGCSVSSSTGIMSNNSCRFSRCDLGL